MVYSLSMGLSVGDHDYSTNYTRYDWSVTISVAAGYAYQWYYEYGNAYVNGTLVWDFYAHDSGRYISGDVTLASGSLWIANAGDGKLPAIGGSAYYRAGYSSNGYGSGGGGVGTGDLYAGATAGAVDYARPPTATTTATYDTRGSGSTSITFYTGGSVPSGAPAISGYHWQAYNGSSWYAITNAGTPFTWTGISAITDYAVRAISYSTEGDGPTGGYVWAYAAPYISSISLPSTAVVGKVYSGTVAGNNVDSYSIFSGSLPPGVTISGATISGTPTTPGTYTFVIRATRNGVSTVDSATQTILVFAGGPWVRLASPWASLTTSYVQLTNNVATVTTSTAHGITELKQPITITGLTSTPQFIGNWIVTSIPSTTTLTFALVSANVPLTATSPAGTVSASYKRSNLKVNIGTPAIPNWTAGYMRVWSGSAWVNTA